MALAIAARSRCPGPHRARAPRSQLLRSVLVAVPWRGRRAGTQCRRSPARSSRPATSEWSMLSPLPSHAIHQQEKGDPMTTTRPGRTRAAGTQSVATPTRRRAARHSPRPDPPTRPTRTGCGARCRSPATPPGIPHAAAYNCRRAWVAAGVPSTHRPGQRACPGHRYRRLRAVGAQRLAADDQLRASVGRQLGPRGIHRVEENLQTAGVSRSAGILNALR